MFSDSKEIPIIAGLLIMFFGAVYGSLYLTEPVMVAGIDLLFLCPDPVWIVWLSSGVLVSLIPWTDDTPGKGARRAKRYILLVMAAVASYYLFEIGSYAGPRSPLLSVIQAYSTGEFRPTRGPWLIGHAILMFTLTSPVLLIVAPGLFHLSSTLNQDIFVRGRALLSYEEVMKRAEAKSKGDSPGPFFGMVRLPERVSTSHFLVCGTTGAGKTTLLRLLMQSALPNVGKGETRALVYDAKQDILSILKGMNLQTEVVTLNPFDERCAGWDIAKDVTSPAVAAQVATILIASEKGGSNPYFYQAARALLTGVMMAFIIKCPGKWTLADVLNVLRTEATLKSVLLSTEHTAHLVERYFSNQTVANDVMSTLDTKVSAYQYVAAAWSRATRHISLSEWLTQEYILVLGNDEETRTAIDAINQVIFKRLSELVIAQPETKTRRTWFFLDELKEAGKLEGLTSLLTKGRSKGACVVLGFQDIEGLSVAYGDNRTAREIVGLCANKAILRTDSPTTAEWASSLFGAGELLEIRVTESSGKSGDSAQKSTSKSEHLQKRESVLASEFMSLPMSGPENGLCGYYLIPEIGAYRVDVGWNSIADHLAPIDPDFPNVVRRPSEHQYLRAWTRGDEVKLGLKVESEQIRESDPKPGPLTSKTSLLELIAR